jgi:prephenate dehydrogenase
MWVDILCANRQAITGALKKLQTGTQDALNMLERGDQDGLQELLHTAGRRRRGLC